MVDDATARAWLAREGFAEGDLRSDSIINNETDRFPMLLASATGNLGMCKWLHGNGAAVDITKANKNGATPMYIACRQGHLSVCQWLFKVGAAADITKADSDGFTPMYVACEKGNLSVC